jgi:hypothetical protein
MHRLVLMPFVIGLLAMPLQAQQSGPAYPLQDNGLYFDSPHAQYSTQGRAERSYEGRPVQRQQSSPAYPLQDNGLYLIPRMARATVAVSPANGRAHLTWEIARAQTEEGNKVDVSSC